MPDIPDNPMDGRGAPLAQHTPGPWLYGQNRFQAARGDQWEVGLSPGSEIGSDGVIGSRGSNFMLVGGICREADARLMAAAPAMLAALKALDAMYRRIAPDDPNGLDPALHPAWKACKAAIAAAEGR